jgi:hypothetical protein
MQGAQLWRGRKRRVETVHQWRERKHSRGEIGEPGAASNR